MALVMVFALVGCGETENTPSTTNGNDGVNNEVNNNAENDAENENDDSESKTVSTDGSTSMESVIGYLREAYTEAHDDVTITYNPTGSSAGIQAVSEGRCDIGLSSRDLKDEELETLDGTVLAIDGIAIIVNNENAVADLTLEQLADIYTGAITNWSEVGGSDAPIVCIGREEASGTRDGFESITGTEDQCIYSQELTATGDVIQAVASNPNAIGYASLSAVGDTVKTVSINGVAPSNETILDGTYAVQRNFVLVTRKGEELTGAAKDFFDYMLSDEAAEYIERAGAVPAN